MSARIIHAPTYRNAAVGETAVQSTPAIALAARLPTAWSAASNPNAEPRSRSGASVATAAVSAVSAQPIPTPAMIKQPASSAKLSPVNAKPT